MTENDGHQSWKDFADKVPKYEPSNPNADEDAFDGESEFFKDFVFVAPPKPPSTIRIFFLALLLTLARLGLLALLIMGASAELASQFNALSPGLGYRSSLYLAAVTLLSVWTLKRA